MSPRRLLTVLAALALAPALVHAQGQPPKRDSTQAQIEQMQAMMGPMMGQMMQSMLEGMLVSLAKPETAERLATFTRNYYDALLRKGFTKAEALEIVTKIGVPMPGMTR